MPRLAAVLLRSSLLVLVAAPALAGAQDGADAEPTDAEVFGPTVPVAAEVPIRAPRSGVAVHRSGDELRIELAVGEWLTVATCGLAGASASGDTTLAIRDPAGTTVATNDDACGSLGSRVVHRATMAGVHVVVLGCFGQAGSCGGRVVWVVGDAEAQAPVAEVSAELMVRALAGPDGQAAIADGSIAVRFMGGLFFRLGGAPLGLGGGTRGGILGGSLQLSLGFDFGFLETSVGAGIASLSMRPPAITQREVATVALGVRAGAVDDFHVGLDLLIGIADDYANVSVDADMSIPIGSVELLLHGVYGFQGVWLGEIGVVVWPDGETRRGVGISLALGGASLFYQPVCRFGLECEVVHYAGPHAGVGLHVRP